MLPATFSTFVSMFVSCTSIAVYRPSSFVMLSCEAVVYAPLFPVCVVLSPCHKSNPFSFAI